MESAVRSAARTSSSAWTGHAPQEAPEQAPPPPGAKPGRVTLREAQQIFRSVRNLRGEVYLAGAIVTTGYTDGPVEVYISEPQDKGTLIRGTPYGKAGKLLFHNFPLPQDERVSNVTPPETKPRWPISVRTMRGGDARWTNRVR